MKILFNNSATYAFDVTTDVVTTAIEPQSDPSHKLIFYKMMRSTMITKRVLGRITTGTRKKLFTKKKDFTWLNPTTREYNYN